MARYLKRFTARAGHLKGKGLANPTALLMSDSTPDARLSWRTLYRSPHRSRALEKVYSEGTASTTPTSAAKPAPDEFTDAGHLRSAVKNKASRTSAKREPARTFGTPIQYTITPVMHT